MSARSLKNSSSSESVKKIEKDKEDNLADASPQDDQMKLSRQEDNKKKEYFEAIALKLKRGKEIAEKAISNQEYNLKSDILSGKYEIKEREWSANDNIKSSRTKLTNSSVVIKKDLENQLTNIQSRLQEQQRDRSSKMMSKQQHQNFMKKIEQQWKDLEQRRQQQAKQEEQQKIEEENRIKEEIQRIQQEKKNKKKQELAEKIKALQEQRRKQSEVHQQTELLLKEKIVEKTMAEKMENQYNYHQNQFLEEKKKRLAEIRALHRPIDKSQLDAFSQKLDQLHQEKQEARKSLGKSKPNASSFVFYRSAFYKKIQGEQKKFLDSKHQQELHKLKQARDKLKRYSQHVRTDCKPIIDDKKAQQLKFRSENKGRSYSSSHQNIAQNPRKIGLRYLQYSKINHKLLSSSPQMETQDEEQSRLKKTDYLAQLRQRNKKMNAMTAHALIQRLDKKQATRQQKAKSILDFTERLQQKAKRKEQIEKFGGAVSQQLDSLYLEAIEAKLSLLDLDYE